jgi:hypothetical protein
MGVVVVVVVVVVKLMVGLDVGEAILGLERGVVRVQYGPSNL